MINSIRKLKVQIFADGADYKSMISLDKTFLNHKRVLTTFLFVREVGAYY